MKETARKTALILLCACPLPSHGQTGGVPGSLTLKFPHGATYKGDTPIVVEIWIGFSPLVFAWRNYFGDVLTSDLMSDWTNVQSQYATLPGTSLGSVSNGGVLSIGVGQEHFPPIVFANTSNPIMVWSGEWSTSDLTPRFVDVTTVTQKATAHGGIHLYNLVFDDPTSQIQVIPAPPALAFLALASGLASRGRR